MDREASHRRARVPFEGGFRMSANEPSSKQNQLAVADYLEDMHAVEMHIEEALDRQLTMFADQPEVHSAVQGFHDMVKTQRDAVAALLAELPKEPVGNTVKDIGSALLGKAAGLIDKIRSESSSKALRDDYTAFNLAAVSYSMLLSTANALEDPKVAALAEAHLRGYAKAVQTINRLIPGVVVHDLEKDGLEVKTGAAETSKKAIEKAWKETAR
jgi:ferritin-like metal-binding protein YciE